MAALYEQGRVHHVGRFPTLEDQLCLWDATSGDLFPDRLDALVWAVTELAVDAVPLRLITGSSPAKWGPTFQDILSGHVDPRESNGPTVSHDWKCPDADQP